MKEQEKKYIEQLQAFINFSSISADRQQKRSIIACAYWLVNHLKSIGMQKAKFFSTSSHPVVYAEYIAHPSYKTILFYGHYDVQPVDPVNKWDSPPFKAVVKNNFIYGRGASDDKGQLFIHIKAVEQLLKSNSLLPVNIKFLIEGAEEIGSAGLNKFIAEHTTMLRCHVAIASDTKMANLNEPAITYSLRGALNAEVVIQSSDKDLHSGTFGGAVPNAALVLSKFINRLHLPNGAIAIPGFYNDVVTIPAEERAFMKANGWKDEHILNDAGVQNSWGERGFTLYERTTIRPSLSVVGITCGYQGAGVKNVIPSTASVKINFRLVPHQHPHKLQKLFNQFAQSFLPPFAKVKITYSSPAQPVQISRSNPFITAAIKAFKKVYGQKAKLIRAGGTIPAVGFLSTLLNIPVVLMGFAQASDNMHAPNEKFYLPNFFKGIETIKNFILYVSEWSTENKLMNSKTEGYDGY